MQLINIPNSSSNFLIENPKTQGSKVVVFLPGLSGEVLSKRFQSFVDAGLDRGFAIVRINAWKDVKDVAYKKLTDLRSDINYVIDYLQQNGYSSIYAVGKSFGGTLLLTLFSGNKNIVKLVLWSPIIGISENNSNLETHMHTPLGSLNSLQDIYIDHNYLKDKVVETLIIHGDADKNISISNSEKLSSIMPNAKIVSIKDADHSYSDKSHEEFLIKTTFDFLSH